MASQTLSIPRLQDKSIIACIEKIAQELQEYEPVTSMTLFGEINVNFDPLDLKNNSEVQSLLEKSTTLIQRINFSCNKAFIRINFYRGGGHNNLEASAFFDSIELNYNKNHHNGNNNTPELTNEKKLLITNICIEELKYFAPNRFITTTPEQNQLQALHEATLDRLEKLSEELITKTHDYRNKLDGEFSDKETELNTQFERLKDGLKLEKEELEKQRKELDDKSNTHARRQIRKDILDEIKRRQEQFTLTKGTNALRRPIAGAIYALIALFLALTVVSVFEFTKVLEGQDFNKIVLSAIKQTIYSAGSIGSILFLIKWQNRWFEQHSTAEFHLKKLELDMERASWVVETALEWTNATNAVPMPNELLQSLTKNLFSEAKEEITPVVHPADQLASALLGSAASIKLKVGDTAEIGIDPKKLEKAESSEK
jgi:hypothetical protein